MRSKGFTQLSVAIDILGNVYLYREAAFLNRPRSERYIIGKITENYDLEDVVRHFLQTSDGIKPLETDPEFFDAYDHVVTGLLNQVEDDLDFGIPFDCGPIRRRLIDESGQSLSPEINPSHFSSINIKSEN